MKVQLARLLNKWAARLHPDHTELIEVRDEYDICRCRIEVVADDFLHHAEATVVQLPDGWELIEQHDVSRSNANRYQHRPHH